MTTPQHIKNELEPHLGPMQLIANTLPTKQVAGRKSIEEGDRSNGESRPISKRKNSL